MADEPGTVTAQYNAEIGEEHLPFIDPNPKQANTVEVPVETPEARPDARPRAADGTFLPKESPTPSTHPRQLLDMARELGIGKEEIESLPTEALQTVVWTVAKRAQHLDRQAAERREELAQVNRAKPAETQAEPEPFADVDRNQFDPAIQQLMDMVKAQSVEMKQLKAQLSGLGQHVQGRENERLADIADRHFAQYAEQLGATPGGELDQASPFLARRRAVLALVDMDTSTKGFQSKLKAALETMYGNTETPAATPAKPAKAARQPDITEEQWRAGATNRPTQRANPPEPPGREKAERTVERLLQSARQAGDENGTATLDDFLN